VVSLPTTCAMSSAKRVCPFQGVSALIQRWEAEQREEEWREERENEKQEQGWEERSRTGDRKSREGGAGVSEEKDRSAQTEAA
jgi:hypothetical protein